MKKFFTLIAAFIASSAMMAQSEIEWTADSLVNGNMEGDDYSAFHLRPNSQTDGNSIMVDDPENPGKTKEYELDGAELDFQEGYGKDGSKGLKIVSYKGAQNAWQEQFWVRMPHILEAGDNVKISFDYRAKSEYFAAMEEAGEEGSLKFDTQAHSAACSYIYYSFAGSPSTSNEDWQHFEAEVTIDGSMAGSNGMGSMAFNLSGCVDYDVEWYFDNFTVQFEKPNVNIIKYWAKLVQNGNMEGDAFDSFVYRLYQQGDQDIATLIEEGAGVDESRALKLVVPAKAANDWDTQFFIKLKEPMAVGQMIKLKMDIRASEDGVSIDSQSHGLSAGAYNHYACIGSPSFTTEWKTYTNTASVTSNMSPEGKEFQYIAFNLAKNDHEVTLYFDNIDVRVQKEGDASMNPDLIELQGVIDDCSDAFTNADDTYANTAVAAAFKAAYETANDLAQNGETEELTFEDAQNALLSAKGKFDASVKDYTNFKYYIDFANGKKEEAKASGYEELAEAIEEVELAMREIYEAKEVGKAEIAPYLTYETVMNMVKAAVNIETIKEGDNVSILMTNSQYNADNKNWQGTSVTVRAGLAEKWHATFDHYQTIANLPAGAYEISSQAFQRRDMYKENDDDEEATLQDVMNAQLYAGNNSVYLTDIDAYAEENEATVPTSMEEAADLFATGADACLTKVTTVLGTDGDLRVGVRADLTHTWVIWDDIKVIYKGTSDKNSYADAVQNMIDIAQAYMESDESAMTVPATTALQNAIDAAEAVVKAVAEKTAEECATAVDDITAALDDAKANTAANIACDEAYSEKFLVSYDYIENATTATKARAEKANSDYDNKDNMTTEELKAFTTELTYLASALLIPGECESATDAEPYDLTETLTVLGLDVDFTSTNESNKNYAGWLGSGFTTGGGTRGPVGERWNSTSGFNTYFTVNGLPEGIYEIACDGAYRVGGPGSIDDYNLAQATDSVSAYIPYLYATTSYGTEKVNLPNVYSVLVEWDAELLAALGLEEDATMSSDYASVSVVEKVDDSTSITHKYVSPQQLFTADLYINNAGYYKGHKVNCKVGADGALTFGIRKEKGASNDWTFVDNFTLTYYGANSAIIPTAIENVQTVASNKSIYTITGVRVANANKAGLYIINGKKVLVK